MCIRQSYHFLSLFLNVNIRLNYVSKFIRMPVIKLDATPSTNDFLKELSLKTTLANFTVVTAEHQTDGRGQLGAKWLSEKGKNLTISILIKEAIAINEIFTLNVVIALATINALKAFEVPQLSVKWPNDIMSGNKKIGGILIENSIKSGGLIHSIVGIGINVNQLNLEHLPKASSIAAIMGSELDRDALLKAIVKQIENDVANLSLKKREFWESYLSNLYKKGIPMPFESKDGIRFMGIIHNVTPSGRLELLTEDDLLKTFEVKEIQMLY